MEEEAARTSDSMKPFEDEQVRRGFMRKVFSLVALQLALVTAAVLITTFVGSIRAYLTDPDNSKVVLGAFVASMFIYLVCGICVSCIPGMSRRFPANIILLFVITGSSAVLLSIVTATFTVEAVMYALGVTTLCCGGVILFLSCVKSDFGLAFGCLLVVCLAATILIAIPHSTALIKLSAGFVAMMFMCVLVYDIHRIMSSSSENALSPEDYIVGALRIYSDILIIFLVILVAISLSSRGGGSPCNGGPGPVNLCPATCFQSTEAERME